MKLKRRNQKRKVISRIWILLIILLLMSAGEILFSKKTVNVINVEGNKKTLYATSTSRLTDVITASDYGKTIDYSVTVNGTTYNDWKVLYNDGKNIQIIMSDFLPQVGIPDEALTAGLEKINGTTYSVYSSQNRDKLLAGLRTGWDDFAKGLSGATAVGAPTRETIEASFQEKYGEPWTSFITDTLYVSRSSYIYADHVKAYWLATPHKSFSNDLSYVSYERTIYVGKYSLTDIGVRPVVFLPHNSTGTVGTSITLGANISSYELTVNPNGGIWNSTTNNSISTLEEGSTRTILNPTREGYIFEGWTVNGTESLINGTIFTMGSENAELIANWKKVQEPEIQDDGRLYTITVDNQMSGHTYNSYQVFTGNFSDGKNDKNENVPVLSNINWGAEFQRSADLSEETYGDKLLEKLIEKNPDMYGECKTAEDVANKLVEKQKDGEEIREFAVIVGEFIKENNITITKGTSVQIVVTENGIENSCYKITDLKPGYYIVIDEKAELDENDAYSRYMIDVVQDVTVKPKSAIPTLEKKVIGDNLNKVVTETTLNGEGEEEVITKTEIDYTRNTAMYKENGEYDINFELTSSVPLQIDGYKTYDYIVTDILSKGLSVDKNSVKVTIGGKAYTEYIVEEPIKVTEENYAECEKYFTERGSLISEDYYGKTILIIKFNDFVSQIKDKTILEGQEIIVTYNAKLNGEGTTGKLANENQAYLSYSSNPYDKTQYSNTNPSKTYTYTIDLDLNKISELKGENPVYEYLGGAKFEIYNESKELIGTITSSDLEVNKGQAVYSSLKAGTYYLKEIEAPQGYNKLREEIELTINSRYDGVDIIWIVEDKTSSKLVEIKIDETGNKVELQVQNTTGFQLPVTGGIGTVIFIVLGLSMMLAVVVYLKSNRKEN